MSLYSSHSPTSGVKIGNSTRNCFRVFDDPRACRFGRMRVVHLWKVKENADPVMLERAREKVAGFRETVPGCLEAGLGPSYVPQMGKTDKDTFGNLGDWK